MNPKFNITQEFARFNKIMITERERERERERAPRTLIITFVYFFPNSSLISFNKHLCTRKKVHKPGWFIFTFVSSKYQKDNGKPCRPVQMPQNMVSDQNLHCLSKIYCDFCIREKKRKTRRFFYFSDLNEIFQKFYLYSTVAQSFTGLCPENQLIQSKSELVISFQMRKGSKSYATNVSI